MKKKMIVIITILALVTGAISITIIHQKNIESPQSSMINKNESTKDDKKNTDEDKSTLDYNNLVSMSDIGDFIIANASGEIIKICDWTGIDEYDELDIKNVKNIDCTYNNYTVVFDDGKLKVDGFEIGDLGLQNFAPPIFEDVDTFSKSTSRIVVTCKDGTVQTLDKADGIYSIDNRFYNHNRESVNEWSNIAKAYASELYTIGLKKDGTIITTEYTDSNENKETEINEMLLEGRNCTNVEKVYLSKYPIYLHNDGNVSCFGKIEKNSKGELFYWNPKNVNKWTDIKDIYATYTCVCGIKNNGSVVIENATYEKFQPDVSNWKNIKKIVSTSNYETNSNCLIGLKNDGTVMYETDNIDDYSYLSEWTDLVCIYAATDKNFVIGLKSDGTLISNLYEFEDVQLW